MKVCIRRPLVAMLLLEGALSFQSSVGGLARLQYATVPTTTELGSSSFDDEDGSVALGFRGESKEPKKVLIDPKTGLYRPMKSQDKQASKKNSLDWDGFKSVVYKGVDVLSTQKQKIQGPSTTTAATKPPPQQREGRSLLSPGTLTLSELASFKSADSRSQIIGSYKEREQEFLNSLKDSPAKRLMEEFGKTAESNKSYRTINDILVKPTPFEFLKSAVYGGLDALSPPDNNGSFLETNQPSTPLKRLPSSLQTREVQARLLASDDAFLSAMEELQSDNPVVRLAAGYKVRRMIEKDEILKQQRERAAQRQARVLALKTNIYKTGDAIAAGGEALVNLPIKASETFGKTVESTKQTIRAVQAVPGEVMGTVENVKQKTKQVQQSVQARVETTKDIIEKTKQIPNQIKSKVQETSNSVQKTAQQTKSVMKTIGNVAGEVTTTSKVMLGLEKPAPKPPKVIPTEKDLSGGWSAQELGWKALTGVGSLAGKATWFVGKETTKLAWKGAELAFQKSKQALDEVTAEEQRRKELAKAAYAAQQAKTKSSSEPLATTTTAPPDGATKVMEEKPATSENAAVEADQLVQKILKQQAKKDEEKKKQQKDEEKKQQQQKANDEEKKKQQKSKDEEKQAKEFERMTKRQEEIDLSLLDLELEIAEALRLAEEAIESAQAEIDEGEEKKKR